ncbi:hypothetical protein HMN09_00125500 [Mycena chlorophos]|uniref:SnoaL-like domain-containing protein n=1 Tax=Mycena chlorophos TaxID=658473 RepID=A0A8H6WN76_MYCCL|nr:hypothetical protein HMN09_00125500 [Mycena chlorophos]
MAKPTPLALLHDYLRIVETGLGPTALEPLLADNFTWKLIPKSLSVLPRTKRDYLLLLAHLSRVYKSISFGEPIESFQSEHSAMVLLVAQGELATTGEPFACEYIFVVHTRDGKLSSVTEFLDADAAQKMFSAGGGGTLKLLQTVF